jgi:octaprenyl-diphosphate synthase
MDYTLDCARTQVAEAIEQIQKIPVNNYSAAMQQVAEFSLARTY